MKLKQYEVVEFDQSMLEIVRGEYMIRHEAELEAERLARKTGKEHIVNDRASGEIVWSSHG